MGFLYFYVLIFLKALNFGLPWILVEPQSQPSNAEIYSGYNHTLKCKFTHLVNCIWFRNILEVPIQVIDRYHYVTGNGDNTTDCSVEIENFQDDDLGDWCCMGNKTIEPNTTTLSYLKSAVPPSSVSILLNGQPLKVLPNRPQLYAVWNISLTCIAENANPEANLHWELDGIQLYEQNSRSIQEDNKYKTVLNFDGDWHQLANSTSLSCIAKRDNYTMNVTIPITPYHKEEHLGNQWSILRIALLATGVSFLAVVIISTFVCFAIPICSRRKTASSTQIIRMISVDDWTTNLSDVFKESSPSKRKTHLPEIPIISYDPDNEFILCNNPLSEPDLDTKATNFSLPALCPSAITSEDNPKPEELTFVKSRYGTMVKTKNKSRFGNMRYSVRSMYSDASLGLLSSEYSGERRPAVGNPLYWEIVEPESSDIIKAYSCALIDSVEKETDFSKNG